MRALVDRIIAGLDRQTECPEDIPVVRNRLRRLRDTLNLHEAAYGRDRSWWRMKTQQEHLLTLQMDYSQAASLAADILSSASDVDLRDRLIVENDLVRCCVETQPAGLTRKCIEKMLAQDYYADRGLAGHLAHPVCGLLAERRGNLALAEEFYTKAWEAWSEMWCEPLCLVEILAKCAQHAARQGAAEDLAEWIRKIKKHHRGFSCDEFLLQFARVLAHPLLPDSAREESSIRNGCLEALRRLQFLPERIYYWEFGLSLLYALARCGEIKAALGWDQLLPVRRKFERQLWSADSAWFAACDEQGLDLPTLNWPPHSETFGCANSQASAFSQVLRIRLASGYHNTLAAAQAEDTRLDCGWREKAVRQRLAVFES